MQRVVSAVWVCSARPELTDVVVRAIRAQITWQVLGVSVDLSSAAAALRQYSDAVLVYVPAVLGALPALDPGTLSAFRMRTLVVTPANPSPSLTGFRLGAVALVSAAHLTRDLPLALAAVRDGLTWCRIEMLPALTEALDQHGLLTDETPRLEDLSVRERDVLFLVARGFANREIADRLALSVKTVETYKHRAMLRLRLRRRRDLINLARRAGWLGDAAEPLGWRPEVLAR